MHEVLSSRATGVWLVADNKSSAHRNPGAQIRSTFEIIVRGSLLVNKVWHCYLQHNYNHPVEEQIALLKLDRTFVTASFTEGLEVGRQISNAAYRKVVKDVLQINKRIICSFTGAVVVNRSSL